MFLGLKTILYCGRLQNGDPGFCSVHRRSLLWWRGTAKHGAGS